jgi:hypothetical protein
VIGRIKATEATMKIDPSAAACIQHDAQAARLHKARRTPQTDKPQAKIQHPEPRHEIKPREIANRSARGTRVDVCA